MARQLADSKNDYFIVSDATARIKAMDFGLSYENHTSYPAPGQIILYPGGISETEILLAYGAVHFASKRGQLAGNHFITIISDFENLLPLGKLTLWEGVQDIRIELTN